MAQIRLKRSTGTDAPSSTDLANAELAFAEGNDILYYGEGTSGSNAASVIKIGGSGAFCDLTTAQTISGNKTFGNNVIVTGDLTVNGSTTTVATTNTTVSDNILELNSGASSNGNDCGIMIERGSTGNNAFIGWDESADQFILGTTTATANSTGNLTISAGTIQGNVTGSAVSLANSRTFSLTGDVTGSATFNGTQNPSIAATIASSSIERGMLDLVSTSSAPGLTVKGDGTTDGYLQLNCSQNSHGIKLKSPPHSATASYTFTLPNDIQNGKYLTTDANGNTSWGTPTNTTYSVGDGGLTTNDFTNADHTKLNGIETSADVTDATNVNAAGAVMNSDLNGKGELLVGDGSGDPTALAAGTDGYILKSDSSEATGLKWAAAGAGGDVNQNAFSNVAVSGQTTVAADSATDTLNLAEGSNVTITTTAGSDTITIAATDTNTTYSVGDGGLTQNNFTNTLKSKLDGIESGATADQSNSEIKTAYEANSDTNAFTDALLTKLSGIASSATNVTNNNQLTNGAGFITSSGSISGNATTATTATTATNVTSTANNSTNETVYVTFVDGATGTQGIETDTGLVYNPSTGQLDFAVLDGGTY